MAIDPINFARTTQVRLRRGTTAQIAANPPIEAEPFYDLTEKRIGVGGTTEIIEQWKSQFLEHTADATDAVPRILQEKLTEVVSVKDFGAVGDGVTDDTVAIQRALDTTNSVFFPDGRYNISAAIKPNDNQFMFFDNAVLAVQNIINVDECAIKVYNASNVEIYNADIDCGDYESNSGIIVRENSANVRIFNTKVVRAKWGASRGGGRAVIIEAGTGTVGQILVDGLRGEEVDTLIGLNGYYGSRKNGVIVSNAIGYKINKLIAIFGNGGSYPHSGEWQQFIVNNVVGFDVTQPIRFDRAGNSIINNVYVFNSAAFGSTDAVVRGTANNVKISNCVFEGDSNSVVDATPWDDSGGSTDLGYDSKKCEFEITHRGVVAQAVLSAGLTRATLSSNCIFNINCDSITTGEITNAQFSVNSTAFIRLYCCQYNALISGFVDRIGSSVVSGFQGENYEFLVGGAFTPSVIGSSSAGSATYSVQKGTYSFVGNLVFFSLYVSWSAHTGVGSLRISGLPTSSSSTNSQSSLSVSFVNNLSLSANNIPSAYKDVGNDLIVLVQSPAGGGAVTTVPIDSAASIMISGHYFRG